MSSGISLITCREVASLTLVGCSSSDGVTIKIPYGVDVLLHGPALDPFFPLGLIKTKSESLEQLRLINVDAYPFLAFSDLTCHLEETRIGVFWLRFTA